MQAGAELNATFEWKHLGRREHLGNLGIDWRIIFKLIL
jgi:hypothetical protein